MIRRSSWPVATAVVWLVTAAMAVWQLLDPAVLDALRRDPSFVERGEWWRTLSPLLVQSDGWPQIVTNLVFLAVIGYFAERRFGPVRWLLLYFTGAIVGEVAGYAWEPHGAGTSVAIFGLVGGLLATFLRSGTAADPIALVASLAWIASLVGLDLGGYVWAAVASSLVVVFATQIARRFGEPTRLYVPAVVVGIAMAGFLVAVADDHGASILAGLAVGLVLVRRHDSGKSRHYSGEVVPSAKQEGTTSPE